MTPDELDEVYTELCQQMTALGPEAIERVLARLALLMIHELDDAERARSVIRRAADLSSWPSNEVAGRAAFAPDGVLQ